MSNGAPRSALEIALARLKQQDEAEGRVEIPLSDAQRQAIAEARNVYEARVAERKILYESKAALVSDPAAREVLDEEYRRDIERLTTDRDSRIARVRAGQP
jgi:hypothetical protein